MNGKIACRVLREKHVYHLYHANTVRTACTFLKNGGLLSRAYVERHGLDQTPQTSDAKDVALGVFDDVFFDSVDIHDRGRRLNDYGPVSFVYDVRLLEDFPDDSVWVTRDNPIRWRRGMGEAERYFVTEDELRDGFKWGEFCQHITLRSPEGPVPFTRLEKVVLDYPGNEARPLFETAFDELKRLVAEYDADVPVVGRKCREACACRDAYAQCTQEALDEKFGL